ncbi:alpha-glucosidase [Microbacterium suwonense]|uniref:Glucohydrolase n=1 Tax=Microbacterium suwonense TaxID=683047 RepID=A0ABM8FQI2_9MICO|nr:alpha-glucosidase [Microbacterium suwonense]BDZ37580.1 glucohydrolase [Microbacterium suwonense]
MTASGGEAALLTLDSRIRDVWAHPLGNDAVRKILLQLGRSTRWIDNPLVGALRLRTVAKLAGGRVDAGFFDALLQVLNTNRDIPSDAETPADAWWRSAVFYQVYPRSFQDSDGDGVGDIPGILSRLDHLQELGVDAVWLSPVYDSPQDDNGYDIRDYRAIATEYGTLDDLDQLIAELHRRGMRLIMDLVVNHTSDEHAWFRAALADPDSPYRDYYLLREGTPDAPPNNWTSFFSGPAWRWFPQEQLWAMHLFSSRQLDLNWEHAPLRAEIVDMVRWWLERGVDGFRLDVINYISKPPALPDGDATIGALMEFTGVEHYFAGPRLHEHLRQLRAEAFDPYGAVSIGETPGVGMQLGRLLTGASRGELDLVFTFDHLDMPGRVRFDDYRYDLAYLRDHVERYERGYGSTCWPAVFFENHDNPRMISKIDPRPEHRIALGRLLAVLTLTLRGTPFLYQGQELGLVNHAFASIDQLRDVESLNRYALLREAGQSDAAALANVLAGSRDHARVPIPWDAGGGFTTAQPWLEGDAQQEVWHAAAQAADPASVLSAYRALIALRRAHPEWVTAPIEFGPRRRGVWTYRRAAADVTVEVSINLTDRTQRLAGEDAGWQTVLSSPEHRWGRLTPYEAVVRIRRAQPANASAIG